MLGEVRGVVEHIDGVVRHDLLVLLASRLHHGVVGALGSNFALLRGRARLCLGGWVQVRTLPVVRILWIALVAGLGRKARVGPSCQSRQRLLLFELGLLLSLLVK